MGAYCVVCLESWGCLFCDLGGKERAQKRKGVAFVFVVALIWVASSFAVQVIEDDNMSPFLLTYIANSLFSVLLPVHFALQWLARRKAKLEEVLQLAGVAPAPRELVEHELQELVEEGAGSGWEGGQWRGTGPLTRWQTLKVAAAIWPIWFLAQFCFNTSLAYTSVTSNTILSSASSLFTLMLSVWILGEKFSLFKFVCVVVCIAGTAMVTFSDAEPAEDRGDRGAGAGGGGGGDGESTDTVGGDALCLAAAFLYACYTVALRKLVPGDDRISMSLMFGMVGATNLVLLGPVAAAVAAAADTSPGARAIFYSLLKGLFDNVLSDYLWARAVLLISPTVATLGLSIQVPIAIAAEVILGRATWLSRAGKAALMIGGGVAVLAGFFGINLAPTPPDPEGSREGGGALGPGVDDLGGSGGSGRSPGGDPWGGGPGGEGGGGRGGGFWDSAPAAWGRAPPIPTPPRRPSLGGSGSEGSGGEEEESAGLGLGGEGGGYAPPREAARPSPARRA